MNYQMKKKYYSNGKLLISAEYLVLDGATALALPTKFGQSLDVIETNSGQIAWKSFDADHSVWFETTIIFDEIKNNNPKKDDAVRTKLIEILTAANNMNPKIFLHNQGFNIQTSLTFPRKWGLGTSSTLINNIAQWFEIDAFKLLKKSFGGSGYDIACAQYNFPILYTLENKKTTICICDFKPIFSDKIYFVYLNQKQNSNVGIKMYREKDFDLCQSIKKINDITHNLVDRFIPFDLFCELLQKHELVLSDILQLSTIKNQLFSDFKGTIKSLGAWGGDFVMVMSDENPAGYFQSKGFDVILTYDEMIL